MKVTIQQRSVYHKYAEVHVEVPDNIKEDELNEYLNNNEDLWVDEMDEAIWEAEYEFGSGVNDYPGHLMAAAEDSEWRYECDELKTGGHL